jgi:hypothetical protein
VQEINREDPGSLGMQELPPRQLSIFRAVAAEHQDGQAEYPARQQVNDLEQHPASQPHLRPSCRRTTQVTHPIE